jgi:hypothetical protein
MHGLSRKAICFIVLLFALIALFSYRGSKLNLKLPPGSGRMAVALGQSHGVILAGDGSLWVWGEISRHLRPCVRSKGIITSKSTSEPSLGRP